MTDKLCINCKWFRPRWFMGFIPDRHLGRCNHPAAYDPGSRGAVTGVKDNYAASERDDDYDDRCGPSGKRWEPKS